MQDWDIIVIGAGISGLSIASRASETARVLLCERESQPGYHASGRSAAVLLEPYINRIGCQLTRYGKPFFECPPAGFGALSRPVVSYHVTDAAAVDAVDDFLDFWREDCPAIVEVAPERVLTGSPIARLERIARAIEDPTALHLDVHALMEGHRRLLKSNGGEVLTGVEVLGGDRVDGRWQVRLREQTLRAAIVVNAAGPWCDEVAVGFGLDPVGLQPLRRTAVSIDVAAPDIADWALVHRLNDELYFKPEGRSLMASLMDETPSPPCDAQPEEFDVAVLMDRLSTETTLGAVRPTARWAGLRTFAGDRLPVIGFDPDTTGFFWYGGQGGFGMQLSPAMRDIAGALLRAQEPPAAIGIRADAVAPRRAGARWNQASPSQPHSE